MKTEIAEMLRIAKELIGIDFPTQDAMNKYLKEHPDADKSNHRVVNMEDHPFNQMRKRKNDKALEQIGRHYKKDPKDLTVDDIYRYNERKGRKKAAGELLAAARELVGLDVPQKHQKNIAISTLKMSDAGARIMGGMTKEEARAFLKSIGYTDRQIAEIEKG
jgi:hypothetical protein